jgi:hypothetical protein
VRARLPTPIAIFRAQQLENVGYRVSLFDDKGEIIGARPATPEERARLRLT